MRSLVKISAAISTMIFIVMIGTLSYHNIEHWSYTDSFYFSSITVMTIGYGDLHPTTSLSKIFTVFYAIAGVAVGLVTLTFIGQYILAGRTHAQKHARRHLRRSIRTAVRYHKQINKKRRGRPLKYPYGKIT